MACLEMYNSDPRISFSNDFADSQQFLPQNPTNNSPKPEAFSSDFEFSVSNFSMMSADELFCQGKLLPFKSTTNQGQRTIRDELLAVDEDDDNVTFRPSKGSGGSNRWKGFLGLKKSQLGSKKVDHKISENVSKNSQEFLGASEVGSSHRDVEIGI